ncbi:hypothetical protein RBB50_000408 [Rhinocladiella similis]
MEVPESKNGSSTIEKPGVAHIASSSSSDVKIDRYVEQVESPDLAQDKERGSNHVNEGEPPWTVKRVLSFVAMGFLWTGSQIPTYLLGSVPPRIYRDIGGLDRWTWFVIGHAIALAAVCPFVGSLSDLLGRRYVALIGASLLVVGMAVCGSAFSMNQFIAGMCISGGGAGICELTCLAGTSELVPARKRGFYVALLVATIIPFCPSALYAQLIAGYGTWRYCCLFAGAWALIGLVGVLFFYFPPPRENSRGLTKRQVISEIDFMGGFLSIAGVSIFVAGLSWGGYQYPWKSAHVLGPMIIGALLLFVAFPVWEIKFATHPMFPSRMKQEARLFTMTLIITAISGANLFSVLMFWPTQSFNVYGHDPVDNGIRTLPIGFAILAGCVICLSLLSYLKGHVRSILLGSSILMTAGTGALACANPNNLHTVYALLFISGFGIGGIVIPASIITTIICPDDIIATVTALTLSIRVIGGCVAYAIYHSVFVQKARPHLISTISHVMVRQLGIYNETEIIAAVEYTASSLTEDILYLPSVAGNQTAYEMIVRAGQQGFSDSYSIVYLISLAFGGLAIICSCFIGKIHRYMDDRVAVDIH